jgi:Holliday junction resolvase RusA-like endonuclease
VTVTERHVYRSWVGEDDCGFTCCLADRLDPIHIHPRRIECDVRGLPRPQGSMQHFANGGAKYPAGVYVWRGTVQAAVAALEEPPIPGAVELRLGFDLPRPQDHFWPVNRNHGPGELHPSAPPHPAVMPDLDKLVRAVCDSITDSGLWHDDAQVCSLVTAKRYNSPPGVHIVITELL